MKWSGWVSFGVLCAWLCPLRASFGVGAMIAEMRSVSTRMDREAKEEREEEERRMKDEIDARMEVVGRRREGVLNRRVSLSVARERCCC